LGYTKVILKRIRNTERVYFFGMMEKNMMDIIEMILSKGMVFYLIIKGKYFMKVYGKMINLMIEKYKRI
jgi:hypothetical protein